MTSTRLRKVALDEPHRKSSNLSYKDLDDTDEKLSRGFAYFQSTVILAIGIAVFYITNTWNVIMKSPDLNRFWFNMGIASALVYLLLFAYIGFYLYARLNIPIEYKILQQYNPYLIPIATASVILSGLFFVVAFWNVWGVMTPVILLTEWLSSIAGLSLIL